MNPLIIYTLLAGAGAGAGVGIAVILDSKNEPKPISLRHDEFLKLIPQIICQYTQSRILNTGTVLRVVDAITRIYGLNEVIAGELIKFEDGTVGISLHLDSQIVGLVLIGDGLFIQEGSSVKATGRTLVNEGYLNHIRNAVIDGRGGIPGSEYCLIESSTPNIISRCSVYEPLLQTGLLIDSMIPIGRGRRKWISGDRQRAKTAVATDTILNQLGKNVRSAYVLIDRKQQAQVLMTFHESKEGGGGLGYSIMVNEPPIIPATYGSKCVYLNSVFVALTFCYHIGWWIRKLWRR